MAKEIELTRGFVALVDDIDFEYLSQFNWCVSHGYAVRKGKEKSLILMHRVILERKLGRELAKNERPDHKDRNRANNTRDNIRLATHKQNTANRSKLPNTSSRFKGVSWHKNVRKWVARIWINGRLTHLGTFSDEKAAAKAYDRMAHALYGEFANLNFPDELMSLQQNLKYAYGLKNEYNCPIAVENVDGSETTIYEVARAVLSKSKLLKWLRDEKDTIRLSREEFELTPFDQFDEWYDSRIAEL